MFALALAACSGGGALKEQDSGKAPGPDAFRNESLRRFASEQELDAYATSIDEESVKFGGSVGGSAQEDAASAGAGASSSGSSGSSGATGGTSGSSSSGAAPTNANITNNQEVGVDEGGIVKNIGDYLVVLRQGRLYAVNVAERGKPVQTSTIAVPPPNLDDNAWYDEMLVRGDRVYVIGYRYGVKSTDGTADTWAFGVTEVSSFRLVGGTLERGKTLYIESSDYFSGSNYASRMLAGELVFYTPYAVRRAWRPGDQGGPSGQGSAAAPPLKFPRYFEANADGTFTPGAAIFAPTDVMVPVALPKSYAVYHTVVKCSLPEDGGFACKASAVLSAYSREHYVTSSAVYLAAAPHVYAFRFSDLGALAHTLDVVPRDQFSFKVANDRLHVVGTSWEPPRALGFDGPVEQRRPSLRLASIPLSEFDARGELAASSRVLREATDGRDEYLSHNRFVGDNLVAAVSTYGYSDPYGSGGAGVPSSSSSLLTHDTRTGVTTNLAWPGAVSRIEPLGDRALVASATTNGLVLTTLSLEGAPATAGQLELPGMSEGESRSHAFFYKPDANAFGLPIVSDRPYAGSWFGSSVSNIAFVDVTAKGTLAPLGAVAAGATDASQCEVSCVDWYGNTRPIFLGDRVFGLMGSELREVTVRPTVANVGPAVMLTK